MLCKYKYVENASERYYYCHSLTIKKNLLLPLIILLVIIVSALSA